MSSKTGAHSFRLATKLSIAAGLALAALALPAWQANLFSPPAAAFSPDVNPPVGTIMAWAGQKNTVPANWRLCNGEYLERKPYQQLFDAIGTVWGGTATTKFRLPDLKGRFLRGVDDGANLDPGDNRVPLGTAAAGDVGSVQPEEFISHGHEIDDPGHEHRVLWNSFISAEGGTYERSNTTGGDPKPLTTKDKTGIKIKPSGGKETRPDNAYVYWIIRVR